MILRPVKAMIKDPIYSFDKFKKDDMIFILSKLPEVDANRTRCISKGLLIYYVEANDIDNDTETDDELDTCLSDSKTFTSSFLTLKPDYLSVHGLISMPMFHNLVELMIGTEFDSHRSVLMVLLNNMPNLEHIISSDLESMSLCPLNERMLSSMDKLSAAAQPWHDLKIGHSTPLIFNSNEKRVDEYTKSQPEITSKMRANLISWIIMEHDNYELTNETLYLTINIIDRFLAFETVGSKEVKFVGMCAMLIASKYQESRDSYEVDDFIQIICKDYKNGDVLVMERRILDRLEWKLNVHTPYFFLTWFIKAAEKQPDTTMENLVYFYAELGLMSYKIMSFCASMVAAAAVYAARATLNKTQVWHETLELQTGFKATQVMKCAKMMVAFHSVAKDGKKGKVIYEKYSSYTRDAVALYPPPISVGHLDYFVISSIDGRHYK